MATSKVNENAVRTSAGFIFSGATTSVVLAFFGGEVWLVKWFTTFMVFDMVMRLAFGKRSFFFLTSFVRLGFEKSPTGYVASLRERRPPLPANERPKRFAWCIALAIALSTSILWWLDMGGPITLSLCMICVVASFLEFALGFCIGCFIYGQFVVAGIAPPCNQDKVPPIFHEETKMDVFTIEGTLETNKKLNDDDDKDDKDDKAQEPAASIKTSSLEPFRIQLVA